MNVLAEAPPAHLPTIVRPQDAAFDIARQAWNVHADQHPAGVCVARSVEHVQAALAYARSHGLRVAVQATGHAGTSLPSLEESLLIKTALQAGSVEVDPVARRARVRAGATWGEVVAAAADHGLAAMHSSSPSVGVVGYLLGGGLSFYGRAHGLAANHVTAVEIVTPDGVLRRVDAVNGSELFWALRGGGGGFGVVTQVELSLLPYRRVTAGVSYWPLAESRRVLAAWMRWTADAPASVTSCLRLLRRPHSLSVPPALRGVPVVCVDAVALDPGAAAALEAELRAAAEPAFAEWSDVPSADVARLHREPDEPTPVILDGWLANRLDGSAPETLVRAAEHPQSTLLGLELRHLGAALATAPPGAGVRGSVEGEFLVLATGLPGVTGSPAAIEGDLSELHGDLAPVLTGTRLGTFWDRRATLDECVPSGALERLLWVRRCVDADELMIAPTVAAPLAAAAA